MREALVFGGSGQIGERLLAELHATGWQVVAVSRTGRADGERLRWLRGDLSRCDGLPARVDAIFSCGPLDAFAHWYATAATDAARVVAFGSTSVVVKQASSDPAERDLAARLREAEMRLLSAAAARGAGATVLRPTLVYGAGRDQTLSRIARLARRWHGFVLPSGARGLRQPVHVEDLARAAIAAAATPATHGRAYDLPGGETLAYRDMVARVLAALRPRPRLIEVPAPVFAALLGAARVAGRTGTAGFSDAALARMRSDLVFDAAPARVDFAYAPRRFAPTADMFGAGTFSAD